MLTTRLNGLGSISRLSAEVDRVFHDVFDRFTEDASWEPRELAFPRVNLWEDDRNLYVEAEVPGVELDDLEVAVTGRTLTLRGERKVRFESRYLQRQERSAGRFERELLLPFPIDGDAVQADLSNGVVTVTLPKAEEARPRKITVQGHGRGQQARITHEAKQEVLP